MCYAAERPGMPGYAAAFIPLHDPAGAKDTARTLRDWVERGLRAVTVTAEIATLGIREFHAECRRRERLGGKAGSP